MYVETRLPVAEAPFGPALLYVFVPSLNPLIQLEAYVPRAVF